MAKKTVPKKVDGTTILYHYLQKSLQHEDIWLFQMLVAKLITSLGVWFPRAEYAHLPIALPHVVRDASGRKRKEGQKDQWSAPNLQGFLRDDNSLIKNMAKSFSIDAEGFNEYDKHQLGNGFVAAHIWRETTAGGLASKNHLTNSFWPNLIWLPKNIAMLTDREGSFAQRFVQATSLKVYRTVEINEKLRPFVEDAWKLLPTDCGIPEEALPKVEELNYFSIPENFLSRKLDNVRTVSEGLSNVAQGITPGRKILHTRYTEGLPSIEKTAAKTLSEMLACYAEGVESSITSRKT